MSQRINKDLILNEALSQNVSDASIPCSTGKVYFTKASWIWTVSTAWIR